MIDPRSLDPSCWEPDPPLPRELRPLQHYRNDVRKTCKICGKPHHSRGFCGKHYDRWYQTGHPLGARMAKQLGLLPSKPAGSRRRWTDYEKRRLLQLSKSPHLTLADIGRMLGRSKDSVRSALKALNAASSAAGPASARPPSSHHGTDDTTTEGWTWNGRHRGSEERYGQPGRPRPGRRTWHSET